MANEKHRSRGREVKDGPGAPVHAADKALNQALDEALGEVSDENLAAREANPESGLAQIRSDLNDANKRVLMAQAELENFRKRTRREQSEQLKYAVLPIVRDLLPVIDNFERALGTVPGDDAAGDSAAGDDAAAGLVKGIGMVQGMLMDVLSQHGCREIPAAGLAFDPMHHEAVSQMPSDQVPAGHVLKVMQTGYQLHDRVIRPTQVIVSQGDID